MVSQFSACLNSPSLHYRVLQIPQLDSPGFLKFRGPRNKDLLFQNPFFSWISAIAAGLRSLLFPISSSQVHLRDVFLCVCILSPSSEGNSAWECFWRKFLALAHRKQNRRNFAQVSAKGQFQEIQRHFSGVKGLRPSATEDIMDKAKKTFVYLSGLWESSKVNLLLAVNIKLLEVNLPCHIEHTLQMQECFCVRCSGFQDSPLPFSMFRLAGNTCNGNKLKRIAETENRLCNWQSKRPTFLKMQALVIGQRTQREAEAHVESF